MVIKGYLSEREPSLSDRIGVVRYGAAYPVARNATAAGRRANRRPDVTVINKAALAEYVGPPRPAGKAMAGRSSGGVTFGGRPGLIIADGILKDVKAQPHPRERKESGPLGMGASLRFPIAPQGGEVQADADAIERQRSVGMFPAQQESGSRGEQRAGQVLLQQAFGKDRNVRAENPFSRKVGQHLQRQSGKAGASRTAIDGARVAARRPCRCGRAAALETRRLGQEMMVIQQVGPAA